MIKRLPDMLIEGSGTFTPPPLLKLDLETIRKRADAIQDQQVKTDLFRLLAEVERLRRIMED